MYYYRTGPPWDRRTGGISAGFLGGISEEFRDEAADRKLIQFQQ